MQLESSSQLVRKAAGAEFVPYAPARQLDHPCSCAMCGRSVPAQQPVHWVCDMPDSFTSEADLIDGLEWICDDCKGMGRQIFIQRFATALVTEEGFYRIRKSEELLYFLQHPPTAPYVMTVSTLKVQHVVWRSEINLDPKLMRLVMDGHLFTVRRDLVLKALAATRSLQQRVEAAARLANPKKKVPKSNDRLWVPNYDVFCGGTIHNAALAQERKLILTMNTGELWVLTRCATAKNEHPEHPSPI